MGRKTRRGPPGAPLIPDPGSIPAWHQPVRQNLGAVLLAAQRSADAEKVYREDLKRNPENGWSLYGLTESLKRQGKTKQAAAEEKRFQKAWRRADVKLAASRF